MKSQGKYKERAVRYKYLFSSDMLPTKNRQKNSRADLSYRKNHKVFSCLDDRLLQHTNHYHLLSTR